MAWKLAIVVLGALGATASTPAPPTPGCLGKPVTIVGTQGDDVIRGTDGRDVIAGLGGNDTIDGLGAADTICGGDGNDTISTGIEGENREPDILSGDAGDDLLNANHYEALVSFKEAPGPVVVNLATGKANGWGEDRLTYANAEFDVFGVEGSGYSDSITGSDFADRLLGGPGDDRISAGRGNDYLEGGGRRHARRRTWNQGLARKPDRFCRRSESPRGIVANLGTGRVTGWGNDRLAGIEQLYGTRYRDRLREGCDSVFSTAAPETTSCSAGLDTTVSVVAAAMISSSEGAETTLSAATARTASQASAHPAPGMTVSVEGEETISFTVTVAATVSTAVREQTALPGTPATTRWQAEPGVTSRSTTLHPGGS